MNYEVLRKEAIHKGAALAKGDALSELCRTCETQKTISTSKLLEHVERIHDAMKDCAYYMRILADKLPPNAKLTGSGHRMSRNLNQLPRTRV